ncbi:hypothetical protein GGR56DRAFT_617984 [Xylariaceae sp. FL0804]|nr:hypothetical protein GGR56DRAFT_617984 [Xylariaceae sp. FL0804]
MRDHLPPGTRVAAEVIKPAGAATAEPTLVAFVAERAGLVPAESEEPLLGATHSAQIEDALADMDRLLSDRLPVYMIPAAYLPLHTMPLLVSAKTDRKRLRALGSSLSRKAIAGFAAAATAPRREPSTPMERELAGLWAAVLGLESSNAGVGAGDNFFVLGGDSLRAMRLVARARSSGVALLTVADIFTHPVLSEMAVAARPAAGKTSRVPEIPSFSLLPPAWDAASARAECAALCDGVDDPARVEDVYPCTPLQEGLMALSAKVGGGGSGGEAAYVAQRVVELPDEAAARRLLAAFEVAARGCAILRTRIVQVPEHGLVQVVVRDDFEHAWWSADRGGLGDYLAADRDASVALGRRLVRYGVVCGGEEETGRAHFVLTMHHALYDGWSMPLIVERVNRAYAGLDTTRLADFKHFIGHLGRMDRPWSEAYWREHLAGAAGAQFPPLPWPGYQPRADSLLEHYVRAGGQPRAGATMATVIRGAWALLVAAYTASASTADVVFGETLTGRNAPIPGVEQVEGPMIATVPVRVAVAVDGDGEDKDANAMTAAEYLGAIHDQSVRGMPHEHLGLQHIRRVSPDAREACELRTGLVLHPSSTEAADNGDSSEAGTFLERPADGFVPASDAEAAQEALKFNTYALMLVCSMDPDGFLVMASFDSNTVAASQMKRMLAQLESVTRQLISHPNKPCAEIVEVLAEGDVAELTRLGRSPSSLAAASSSLLAENQEVTETWIVDPANAERLLPLGAVGELVVRCPSVPLDTMDQVTTPKYADSDLPGCLYRTQKLAKYSEDGKLESVERTQRAHVPQARQARKHVSATSRKQKELRRAWSRVLSIEEDAIGLDDSFFQLGGDSIGAMKIVADLRARGLELTVPDIFKHRTLYETAKATTQKAKGAAGAAAAEANKLVEYAPFSLLQDEGRDVDAFLADTVRPTIQKSLIWQQDGKKDYTILDVLPARPLQRVAVRGTTRLPRYSARYELFHFDGPVDRARLFGACGQLVARNEILRTVFVEDKEDAADAKCYGVVLDALDVAFEQHECDDDDLEAFCHRLCDADIQTDMPLGSAFVKFMFVQQRGEKGGGEAAAAAGGRSSLILRISHAQYDEICLVGLLRQLAALYNGHPETTASPAPAVPFSAFVHHVVREAIPRSIPYWRDLLRGSGPPTRLRPGPGCCSSSLPLPPLRSRAAGALTRTLDISARPRDVTVATLPTAAWALCLARRLALRDVVFGEVVSGRNIDLPIGGSGAGVGGAEAVMGPTWQYVPVRVCFEGDGKSEEGDCKWTGLDLLRYVQHQHIASAQHEGMGLGEMARSCTDWPPPPPAMGLLDGEEEEAKGEKEGAAALEDYWFDSVVHQDVYHVERLDFFDNANAGASTGTGCRLETVYPHAEPLREWKVQAFAHRGGDSLTLEIVTFKDWLGVAAELLDEMAKIMDMLVRRPDKRLF